MKGLFCLACGDIRGILDTGYPTTCECGACSAGWDDPRKGLAWFFATDRRKLWGLGFHNGFLSHEGATWDAHHVWETADGYYFKTMESPVVKFKPGFTSDTRWATDEQGGRAE